jgi:hypothetical protein
VLSPEQISRFYAGWEGAPGWPKLWAKQFRIRTSGNTFITLNRKRRRLNFNSLHGFCVEYAPVNVYMSVINWLMPDRVSDKHSSRAAHPTGGEYVVDVDSYLGYRKHSHVLIGGVCEGCLENSKRLTERLLDRIEENYRDVRVVFSGKSGFHIHVLDFDVQDWTFYCEEDPLRSHEVARFKYTKHVSEAVKGGFDRPHFILSSDVLRIITVPDSLNGETGLTCTLLGSPFDFRELTVHEIVEMASSARGRTIGANWVSLNKVQGPRRQLVLEV